MSVYKPTGSSIYVFDFRFRGDRFHGSTGETERRKAEAVEAAERARVKKIADQRRASNASLRLDDVAGRYWTEIGQHHAGATNTFRDIGRLVAYFGKDRLLTEITDNDVAQMVAWRRGHRVWRRKTPPKNPADAPLISNATVNRSTTEVLKKLFTRAKAWGVRFDHEPDWRRHWLDEPEERVRELVGDEGQRLCDATRADYEPFFAFAHAAPLRLRECLLRWSEVDWAAKEIRKKGKGRRTVVMPITPTVRAILKPLRGHHPEMVFTYVAARTRDIGTPKERIKGRRYPITYAGVKTAWRRLRAASGVTDFRFHDFRHDVGTKLLRATGNLKLVQRTLNHGDIKTTTRYAHVVQEEVATALEDLSRGRRAKSRKNPQGRPKKKV